MKLPRDVSGTDLCKRLEKLGYFVSRQTGSHLRLSKHNPEHHITIPNHSDLKIGTLNSILQDIANQHKASKTDILKRLF